MMPNHTLDVLSNEMLDDTLTGMDDVEIITALTRLKRGTSNRELYDLYDAIEKRLLVKPTPNRPTVETRVRFDKNAYQREYMRTYRKKPKNRKSE